MIRLPHQILCEPSDYRPSQAYFSGVTLLISVALKLTHVPIVAVCAYVSLASWMEKNRSLMMRSAMGR